MASPRYTLYYWPLPGRGAMIRSLFAYCDVPFTDAPADEVIRLKQLPYEQQPIPLRAPPFLVDHANADTALSQTVAVAHYVATNHGLSESCPN